MGKKVLIIDDETDLSTLIKTELQASRYEVVLANDGQMGLETAQRERPDLIILDIMMPKMDGYAVLKRLRADDRTRKTPVIMLSARSETNSIFTTQELGATDYLIKPFEAEELLTAVRRSLAG